jgi:hypothetical protein
MLLLPYFARLGLPWLTVRGYLGWLPATLATPVGKTWAIVFVALLPIVFLHLSLRNWLRKVWPDAIAASWDDRGITLVGQGTIAWSEIRGVRILPNRRGRLLEVSTAALPPADRFQIPMRQLIEPIDGDELVRIAELHKQRIFKEMEGRAKQRANAKQTRSDDAFKASSVYLYRKCKSELADHGIVGFDDTAALNLAAMKAFSVPQ